VVVQFYLERGYEVAIDQDREEITLYKGIPHHIQPKALSEKLHPFGIRIKPLQRDDDDYPDEEDTCSNNCYIHDFR